MKTEKEIRERIKQIQRNKYNCKRKGLDAGYVTNLKIEKALKWVLEEMEESQKEEKSK